MQAKVRGKARRQKITAADIFLYILFGVFAFLCTFPFYYIFIITISNNDLVSRGMISLVPRGIHFGNYVEVMKL